jgi:hypothetical protein
MILIAVGQDRKTLRFLLRSLHILDINMLHNPPHPRSRLTTHLKSVLGCYLTSIPIDWNLTVILILLIVLHRVHIRREEANFLYLPRNRDNPEMFSYYKNRVLAMICPPVHVVLWDRHNQSPALNRLVIESLDGRAFNPHITHSPKVQTSNEGETIRLVIPSLLGSKTGSESFLREMAVTDSCQLWVHLRYRHLQCVNDLKTLEDNYHHICLKHRPQLDLLYDVRRCEKQMSSPYQQNYR